MAPLGSTRDCSLVRWESPGNSVTSGPFSVMTFAKTVHTIRTKLCTVIFYTIVWSMCAISINSYNWDWSESEGKRPKPTPLPHIRLWFFDTPEVTKIVLPKILQNFKKTPNCTYWPKELNQKSFPCNIQYRTRSKGPPFSFFRHCETFSGKNSPKGPLQFFGSFATECMLKNLKGSLPLSVFFGIVILFQKKIRVL